MIVKYYGNELCHHGVLGQRWGIRRYQNYDGSYTQAGVAKYKNQLEEHTKADNTLAIEKAKLKTINKKENKEEYAKQEQIVKEAKQNEKSSRKIVNDTYKKLKNDMSADKGKKLYSEGRTINSLQSDGEKALGAILVGGGFASTYASTLSDSDYKNGMRIGGLALSVIGATIVGRSMAKDNQLRAYYSHSSSKK